MARRVRRYVPGSGPPHISNWLYRKLGYMSPNPAIFGTHKAPYARKKSVWKMKRTPIVGGGSNRSKKVVRRRKKKGGKFAAKFGVFKSTETITRQLQTANGFRGFITFGDQWNTGGGKGLFTLVEQAFAQPNVTMQANGIVTKPLIKVYLHNVRHHLEMVNSFQLPCMVTVYFLDYKRKAVTAEEPEVAIKQDYVQAGTNVDVGDGTQHLKDVFGPIVSGTMFKKVFKVIKKQTRVLQAGEHWATTYVQNVESFFDEQKFSSVNISGAGSQSTGLYQHIPKFTPPVLIVMRGLPAHAADNESQVGISGARLDIVHNYTRSASVVPYQRNNKYTGIASATIAQITSPEQASYNVEETTEDV